MILLVDSDTAYLIMLNTKSRITRYFQINNDPKLVLYLKLNRAILIECKALYHVVSSAAKAKITGIFHNAQITIPIQYILE